MPRTRLEVKLMTSTELSEEGFSNLQHFGFIYYLAGWRCILKGYKVIGRTKTHELVRELTQQERELLQKSDYDPRRSEKIRALDSSALRNWNSTHQEKIEPYEPARIRQKKRIKEPYQSLLQ